MIFEILKEKVDFGKVSELRVKKDQFSKKFELRPQKISFVRAINQISSHYALLFDFYTV